jgi:hypothetical protein
MEVVKTAGTVALGVQSCVDKYIVEAVTACDTVDGACETFGVGVV